MIECSQLYSQELLNHSNLQPKQQHKHLLHRQDQLLEPKMLADQSHYYNRSLRSILLESQGRLDLYLSAQYFIISLNYQLVAMLNLK